MKKRILLLIILMALVNISFTGYSQTTTSGFAKVNGTSLYYEITGKGTPIVFLHGFTCDHRNWNPQVKYFSKKYKVITFDARGHGKSLVPDTIPYRYVDDLAALMDYLKIEKAVVVGHSMGGIPAFLYALDHPDRVAVLVLAEGGPMIRDTNLVDIDKLRDYMKPISNLNSIARKEGIEKAKEAFLNLTIIKPSIENPKSNDLVKTMMNDYSGWHWQNKDPQKSNPLGTGELLSKIKTPTLIITGDLSHDALKEMVSVQYKYIPNSKKVILTNSGHMLNIENPDQFNKELNLFLKQNNIK